MYRSSLLFIVALLSQVNLCHALCVVAEEANLRSRPSASGTLIWKVGKYMPLIELKEKSGWYLVKDLEGKKMWISAGLVSAEIDCAVIKVAKSSLRRGPGTEFSKTPLNFAHKYMPFKKLERDGAWLHLEDDYGYKHWVVENNLWEPLDYTTLSY